MIILSDLEFLDASDFQSEVARTGLVQLVKNNPMNHNIIGNLINHYVLYTDKIVVS